jgi:hypothetical protein
MGKRHNTDLRNITLDKISKADGLNVTSVLELSGVGEAPQGAAPFLEAPTPSPSSCRSKSPSADCSSGNCPLIIMCARRVIGTSIVCVLEKGEIFGPLLFEDEEGTAHGNVWAQGFMRGVSFHHEKN